MPLPKKFPRTGAGSKGKDAKRVLANRYRVEKKLGSGNFGTAWLVTDLKCKEDKDKLKVLKEIPVGDLQPDETVDAMHEASLLRNLDHPNIVKFHDSFIEGEFFCIVTEYAEGGDMDNRIQEYKKKQKKIPEAQAVEWIIQLMLAVQYMHDRRVLHRDLKTRNIFLRNNVIKVGDFGISRILMGSNDVASTFVGTPYYMSPEVLKHEGYNSKSDVWSVGCVLYELVSLEHAFEGQSLMGVMYKIVNNEMPKWPAGYSGDLKSVFTTLLETEPSSRVSASEALKLPFIAKEMEALKNTMMVKHHNKEQKDVINRESHDLAMDMKKHHRLDSLKKDSEDKKWKNLPPRERMRLRKQMEADKQAKKIAEAARQQREENQVIFETIKQKSNPYDSHAPMWKAGKENDPSQQEERPTTGSVRHAYVIEPSSSEEESGSEEDDFPTVRAAKAHTVGVNPSPSTLTPSFSRANHTMNPDDRPITPMRDKMIYNKQYSSLDFKDGIPEQPDMAETYYSQFEGEFEGDNGASSDEDNEGTLIGGSMDEIEDEEVEDLISCMQNALDKSDTIKSQTLADNTLTDAFGPAVRETKIRNLRTDAENKLGKSEFDRAYEYLKQSRFGTRESPIDEKNIMRGLGKIVKNPNDCFIVDQLLFLEAQADMSKV